MNRQNKYNKKWMDKQKSNGLCIFCKNKSLDHSNLCERHWFLSIANMTLGNRGMANDIRELFYAQDCKCYLTGEELILGKNASLDHFIPRSKNMNLVGDIRNLGWCTKDINRLKNNFEINEFINMCKRVVEFNEKISR